MTSLSIILIAVSILMLLVAFSLEFSNILTLSLMIFIYAILKAVTNHDGIITLSMIIAYSGWRFYIYSLTKKRILKDKNKKYQKLLDEVSKIEISSNSRRAAATLERLK